jgi:glycosyltransferase involved in cell wall biosynthesis
LAETGPLVSVLCPVYQGAAYLSAAVASIRAQTLEDWEMLLLDDGSRDGSGDLCAELAREEPRIRHLRHAENRGLGAAMATLAREAKGTYLAVQEQDDASVAERLELEVDVLESDPKIGLVSGLAEWLDDLGDHLAFFPGLLARGEQYPQDTSTMVRFLYVEQCKVVNAGCCFRRSLLDDPTVFFDREARLSVDWQLFVRLAHRCRIWGLPRVVVRMRRGAGHESLSRRKAVQFTEARRCLRRLLEAYEDDPESPIDRRLYRQALAHELVLEGRHWGRGRGLLRLLQAAALRPGSGEAWRSLGELVRRAAIRLRARDEVADA